jgi:protein ImuB
MRLAYLFLPRFPVQRRVLEQPSLAGQPLVLWADVRGAQRVCFASGTALRRGLKPGLSVAAIRALDPNAAQLRYDEAAELQALSALGEALLPLTPGFQVDRPEGLWLDASAAPLSGGEVSWARRVIAACRALGLAARCVVGTERFTTQALGRFGVGEATAVLEPHGAGALGRLPLTALEDGWLGPAAAAPFRALGLTSLGEVAALSAGALVARFGAAGLTAARLCRGEDDSRFRPDALPEVLEESVQLDWPAEHLEPVLFALKMLSDRVCARLQGRQQAAVRLTVTVVLDGAPPLGVPLVLARPSSQGRMLLDLTRHRLLDLTVQQPIVALTMRVDEAGAEAGRQLLLGEAPAGEAALEVVLARLQSALGEAAVFSARPEALHRPEAAWSPARFAPPSEGVENGFGIGGPPTAPKAELPLAEPSEPLVEPPSSGWPKRKAKVELKPELALPVLSTRPPRLLKAPARLKTELDAAGALSWVDLAGRRRRVESVWGPERLVGAWWEDGYARDYYRVQLEGVGTWWLFRDGRDGTFFAQGVFD